jgi:hypothetical protein
MSAGRHEKALGPAHAEDSGRRTSRGAIAWRAADPPRPTPARLTPEDARQALAALLAEIRMLGVVTPEPSPEVRTLADARDEWLRHIEFDRQRKRSTVKDYRGQSRRLPYRPVGAKR